MDKREHQRELSSRNFDNPRRSRSNFILPKMNCINLFNFDSLASLYKTPSYKELTLGLSDILLSGFSLLQK